MRFIIPIIVLILIFGGIAALVEKIRDASDNEESRQFARKLLQETYPFIGIFLIAAMIAILGVIGGILFPTATEGFITVSLWIAVLGVICICVKIIIDIAKHFFIKRNS